MTLLIQKQQHLMTDIKKGLCNGGFIVKPSCLPFLQTVKLKCWRRGAYSICMLNKYFPPLLTGNILIWKFQFNLLPFPLPLNSFLLYSNNSASVITDLQNISHLYSPISTCIKCTHNICQFIGFRSESSIQVILNQFKCCIANSEENANLCILL